VWVEVKLRSTSRVTLSRAEPLCRARGQAGGHGIADEPTWRSLLHSVHLPAVPVPALLLSHHVKAVS